MSVKVETADNVAVVTICRPEALNALNTETLDQLRTLWRELDDARDVRCIIVTGEGSRAFSVGSDLKEDVNVGSPIIGTLMEEPRGRSLSLLTERTPVIAAISGYCMGGGLELALACDIRVADSSAVFGLPEIQIGSYPGGGGVQRLLATVPKSVALEMLLTGERLTAERALELGLVSRLAPGGSVLDEARCLARRVAESAPIPVAAVKRAIAMGSDREVDGAMRLEELLFTMVAYSEDRNEGRAAFRAKRKPLFRGQ